MSEIKRQECLVYSRCCGWFVPKTQTNPGKKAEWGDRKQYVVNNNAE